MAAGGLGRTNNGSGTSVLGGLLGGTGSSGAVPTSAGYTGTSSGMGGVNFINSNTSEPQVVPVPVPVAANVTEHQYYEDTIKNLNGYYANTIATQRDYFTDNMQNQKDFFTYAQGISDRICSLEQRVAVDETAISKNFEFMNSQNEWQNKFFDEKMRYADLLEQCRIDKATCKCIQGEVFASPSNIADPYIGSQLILGSRQVFPSVQSSCDSGWTTWNNGCGCGNY